MKKTLLFPFLLAAAAFISTAPRAMAGGTPNYVYTDPTDTSGDAQGQSFASPWMPTSAQALTVHFKIEFSASFQHQWWDNARLYYTTDGTNPSGSFGVASGTTTAVNAAYIGTGTHNESQATDDVSATIPALPTGTVVKYIVSAWNSGDSTETFGNSGNCCGAITSSANATVHTYTVGGIPARFGNGALLATQTRPVVDFGDNQNELDQLYARIDPSGVLHVGITGNIATGNGVVLFLDTKSGGNGTLNFAGNAGRVKNMNGTTWDTGFLPDYALDGNVGGTTFYVDYYDLNAGTQQFTGSIGLGATGSLSGGNNNVGVVATLDDANTAGVTATSAAAATTATAGYEVSIPLSSIGGASIVYPIKIVAVLSANSGFASDEILPGLPDTYGDIGNTPNFQNIPGIQYATVGAPATANDLASSTVKWAHSRVDLTGSGSVDPHPSVTSSPTVYNGIAYVVDSNNNLVALDATANGTASPVSGFGSNGKVPLDAPVAGRVAVSAASGTVRVYALTTAGTLFAMDAGTGANKVSLQPVAGATASATPAVIQVNGAAVAYFPVKTSASVPVTICKVTDGSPMTSSTLDLVGGSGVAQPTDAVCSPSVARGGLALQLGTVSGSSGVVYTLDKNLTILNAVSTANPVKAPTTLSANSATFYVGDAPASGNGSFYAFNASNGNPVTTFGANGTVSSPITGAIDQAAFADYAPGDITNALYFATTTGQVNALNPATGAEVSGYPASPFGALSASGSVVLLNNNLYVPTVQGLYIVPKSGPTTYNRFPTESAISSLGASGRVAGSVVSGTGGNGNVYGFVVQ